MRHSHWMSLQAMVCLWAVACNGNGTPPDAPEPPRGTDLGGSKQGQSVGFVDVDGDGTEDKVVGAPGAATAEGLGAVLVYKGTGTSYVTSGPMVLTGDDNFGTSFVNLGDVDGDGFGEFAVGALHGGGEVGETALSGSVTVYKGGRNGEVLARLGGENPFDRFGFALAAGDLNADGVNDLVVSAPFNTHAPALYQQGAAYVYFGPAFDPSSRVALYATSSRKGLGWSVATGDHDGDGVADLLLSSTGAVLVFHGGAGFAPDVGTPDVAFKSTLGGFGKALQVVGDLDADGKAEVAIGAPMAVVGGARDTGCVYVVRGGATGTVDLGATEPPAELLVRLDGEGLFNRFGTTIKSIGDFDRDGVPDFAVGAPLADVTTNHDQNILSGKVYVFRGSDVDATATIAVATAFLGTEKNQGFGMSLAVGAGGHLLIGGPRLRTDTGGVSVVDPASGAAVPGGSTGGVTGEQVDCH